MTYMQNYHLELVTWCASLWNTRYREFGGFDILAFVDSLGKQEKMVNGYGMTDPRFGESYNELISQWASTTFKNMMPMVLEVCKKTKVGFAVGEGGKLEMHAPTDLFKLVSTVFDNYFKAPHEVTLRGVLGLGFKMIQNFQTELMNIVNTESLIDIDAMMAMTNSSMQFITNTKGFCSQCAKLAGYQKEEIERMFSSGMIIKTWAGISNAAFLRFQQMLQNKLADDFMAIFNHKQFDCNAFTEKWFIYTGTLLQKLQKSYGTKCWRFVFEEFTTLYVGLIIKESSDTYKPSECVKFHSKVEQEIIDICHIFEEYVYEKDFEVHKNKLGAIRDILKDPPELIMGHIGILR